MNKVKNIYIFFRDSSLTYKESTGFLFKDNKIRFEQIK